MLVKEDKEIVYCPDRKCPNERCARHHSNTPWDEDYKRDTDFGRKKDTDVSCKYELMEE